MGMITVDKLVKRFGSHDVIKEISMTVARGSVDAIIGPSGGGKSTFLRCINGLAPFQGGRVIVDGLELTPETTSRGHAGILQSVRKRVGMVFQELNLFPHLTVLQNLCEAPVQVLNEPRREAERRAIELLDHVGLALKKDVLPKNLSGGQMQRVAIARTLMMRPEAILFDEPTSALDPVMASEVLAIIGGLAKEGQTMIVVTHSMAFARNVANRVHVFAEGQAVEEGPPNAVFEDPKHPGTKALLSHSFRE